MNLTDAARQRAVDNLQHRKQRPLSDKRFNKTAKRYIRAVGHHFLVLAACGCDHVVTKPGGVCPACGGAELTNEERQR